jgi:hypothetical protein
VPPASSIVSERPDGGSVLTQDASDQLVSQVNAARAKMSGRNKHPLPTGEVTVHPDGYVTLIASGRRRYNLRANGTLASFSRPSDQPTSTHTTSGLSSVMAGSMAKFSPSGRLRSLLTASINMQHGPRGGRTVVKRLPEAATVVSYGPRSGYFERKSFQNRVMTVQRTYVAQNATYVRTYNSYSYRGVKLLTYVSAFYYPPPFYSWVYYPWPKPISFLWNWRVNPWFGIYGLYFVPMPFYTSPALWLTDDILASTLADGYDQQQDASASGDPDAMAPQTQPVDDDSPDNEVSAKFSTPITPALQTEIAAEVQQNLAAENSAASDQPSADQQDLSLNLQPNRVFVVSTLLNVSSDKGNCSLTGGDILRVVNPIGSDPQTALLSVASSKAGDCPPGTQMELSLPDLQDMDNDFRAQMDASLAKLHSNQGQGGLPAAPQVALALPAAGADPAPEPGVADMLAEAQQQASEVETELLRAAFAGVTKSQ